ncbi:diaminopimelate epimerase [Mobilisporobacter senegalensis]|uniref:Diaminopimelate epimerase n=1 Tax=Mobilisporobacter senegalensis TaxID=1329262 RepID=A0A3N1XMN2_9FIRM|nr:diaminopimelate epimerase [Mobilisporobacter senegalensis]ROR27448.1 diaminopimelate epimerase [Mobilisporobacter senegalensis]
MQFTKMQGCGNDYIYINCLKEEVKNPSELAVKLSDRHFGIGGDGIVLIEPSDRADFFMSMYNADGSRAEMCGNAIRCVGKYVYERHMTDKTKLSIDTLAGIKFLELKLAGNTDDDRQVSYVTVNMGNPILEPEMIPVLSKKDVVIQEEIMIDHITYQITCVSMGNPHAVVFVDDVKSLNLEEIGPKFEHHDLFPRRINTEFIQVVDKNHIIMRVWERGSGETLACGTGACASVVAGLLEKRLEEHVTVELIGGSLEIFYDQTTNIVYMTGPAVEVFTGVIDESIC